MTHENKKTFKCKICDSSCALSATLKRQHKLVHEKTKLFKFEICDYRSAQRIEETSHEAVHEGTLTKYIITCW